MALSDQRWMAGPDGARLQGDSYAPGEEVLVLGWSDTAIQAAIDTGALVDFVPGGVAPLEAFTQLTDVDNGGISEETPLLMKDPVSGLVTGAPLPPALEKSVTFITNGPDGSAPPPFDSRGYDLVGAIGGGAGGGAATSDGTPVTTGQPPRTRDIPGAAWTIGPLDPALIARVALRFTIMHVSGAEANIVANGSPQALILLSENIAGTWGAAAGIASLQYFNAPNCVLTGRQFRTFEAAFDLGQVLTTRTFKMSAAVLSSQVTPSTLRLLANPNGPMIARYETR